MRSRLTWLQIGYMHLAKQYREKTKNTRLAELWLPTENRELQRNSLKTSPRDNWSRFQTHWRGRALTSASIRAEPCARNVHACKKYENTAHSHRYCCRIRQPHSSAAVKAWRHELRYPIIRQNKLAGCLLLKSMTSWRSYCPTMWLNKLDLQLPKNDVMAWLSCNNKTKTVSYRAAFCPIK